ncbi:hypothetical protein Kisp01_45880 [Kineosporia sp. NBRC 101677]|nr:hypothetical protein Kisp01_45880 [Kineosporia sp. NBRC 101677]
MPGWAGTWGAGPYRLGWGWGFAGRGFVNDLQVVRRIEADFEIGGAHLGVSHL